MNILLKIKIFFLLLFSFNLYAQDNCLHKVKKDENIIKILKHYNKYPIYGNQGFLKEFLKLNEFKNINLIYPGQTVIIPDDEFYFRKNQSVLKYKVKKNDSLSKILKSHDLFNTLGKEKSIKNILELNPHINKRNKNGDLIYPEEIIYLNISHKFSKICGKVDINNKELSEKKITYSEKVDPELEHIKPEKKSIEIKSIEFNMFPEFYLKAIQSYQRIDIYDILNNSNAALISNAGYGLVFAWDQHFTENFYTEAKGKYQYISFKQLQSNNLSTSKQNISDYEVSANLKLLNFFNFSLLTNKRYFLYTYATSSNSNSSSASYDILIDSIAQYGLGMKTSLHYEFFNTFKIYGNFNYSYYFRESTSNYNISPFHLYLYGLTLEKNIENIGIHLGVDYTIAKQNTSITTQKLQILDVLLGIKIDLK